MSLECIGISQQCTRAQMVTEEQNLVFRPQIIKLRDTGWVQISDLRHAETADGVRSSIDQGPLLNCGCVHAPCIVVQGEPCSKNTPAQRSVGRCF